MALRMAPSSSNLVAVPMSAAEFAAFIELSAASYADGAVAAGSMTSGEAAAKARLDIAELLPSGLETEGQLISVLRVEDVSVGHLWVGCRGVGPSAIAWVWDVYLGPEDRGVAGR
jgi:hypothetical protein